MFSVVYRSAGVRQEDMRAKGRLHIPGQLPPRASHQQIYRVSDPERSTPHVLALSSHITRIPGRKMVIFLLRGEQTDSETQ